MEQDKVIRCTYGLKAATFYSATRFTSRSDVSDTFITQYDL